MKILYFIDNFIYMLGLCFGILIIPNMITNSVIYIKNKIKGV